MKKNANKGFSLVELIIVIAIMAVLIGVLAPQFIKQVEKSRESTDLQTVDEIKVAVETLIADYGENATSDVEISVPNGGGAITVTGASITVGSNTHDLTDYGIVAANLKVKSKKWTAYTWTYSKDKYTWTCSLSSGSGATYFDVFGNPI